MRMTNVNDVDSLLTLSACIPIVSARIPFPLSPSHTNHVSCFWYRVSIIDAKAFFDLFDEVNTGSARNTYFGNLNSKKRNRMIHELDLAECAFNLLQWAQYGDVPDFAPTVDDGNCKKPPENDGEKQANQ